MGFNSAFKGLKLPFFTCHWSTWSFISQHA